MNRFLFAPAFLLLTALTASCSGGGGSGGGSGGTTAPTVVAVSPSNDATNVADNVTISAGFSTPMNAATLTPDTFKLVVGAAPVAGAINYTGLTATFTPNADLTAGTYTATITTGAKDVAGNPLAAAHTWSFSVSSPAPDTVPPTVATTSPDNLATGVAPNSVVTATFSEGINATTLTNASFTLTGPGPSDVLSGTVTYDIASQTARFSPSQALKNTTTYTAKISTGVTDAAGNALLADNTWTFTTVADTTSPTVLSTFPASGATGVATNSTITANFSEPMNSASLTNVTFELRVSGVAVTGGMVTPNGSSATLSVGLLATTTYTATITTSATDVAGNGLASNYSWSFTTAAAPDNTPPFVVSGSRNPVPGATGVSRNTTVSAIFSEAMNPSTLTASVFTLTNPGAIPASVNYNPATLSATLTPNSKLAPLATHTANILAGATDAAGNALPPDTWSFTTRDGEWGTAQTIESTTGDAGNPSIAFDSSGNALAVWQQNNGIRIDIFANRYTAATSSWGTPEAITHNTTDSTLNAENPRIAVSPTGEAIAVWQQSDGTRNNIWFNRFAGAWGTAAVAESAAGEAVNPQIVFDTTSGNAIAVWQQFDGARVNIYSSRYTAAWSTPTALTHSTTDNLGDAENPQIAIRANGDVMVVWQQYDFDAANVNRRTNIWANRYDSVSLGWGTAIQIDMAPGNALFPHVVIDSSGNALAVWQQTDGNKFDIWANRYVTGSGWSTAETIESDSNPAIRPHAAMDASGNSIVVWAALSQRYNFYANRLASTDFVAGSWGLAELIETANAGGVQNPRPQIMFDGNGHALAVWHDGDDVNGFGLSIWSNRYIAGTGWSAAQLIENVSTANASSPRLAVDNNGNAFAIWSQSDGRRTNIYLNRFQ